MLLAEVGSLGSLDPPKGYVLAGTWVLPVEWLCGNIFRVQAAGNTALDLLQQHACQLGLQGWATPSAGAAPHTSPGSLLRQVQLTCTLLQQWCDWISRHSEEPQAVIDSAPSVHATPASTASSAADFGPAAQGVSEQQQQQQQWQLLKGLQGAVGVLSDQLLPALTELQELAGQWAQNHGCDQFGKIDLDSDDPEHITRLSGVSQWLGISGIGRSCTDGDAIGRGFGLLTALSGVAGALQAASSALAAAVPCSYTCNNLSCSNLSTVSEAFALVRGKACVCGGCLGVVRYCSTAPPGSQSLLAAR